jgi:Lysine methyltransferase
MVAHVLGADVILTEQKELLSLLKRNLSTNFSQIHVQSANASKGNSSELPNHDGELSSGLQQTATTACGDGDSVAADTSTGTADDAAANSEQIITVHTDSAAAEAAAEAAATSHCSTATDVAVTCPSNRSSSSSGSSTNGSSGAAAVVAKSARIQAVQLDWERDAASSFLEQHLNGRYPDFILSADCVYVPLYGDSWRALITVLTGLSGPQTIILVSVERRTADGIDEFLAAASAAGLTVQCVYESTAAGVPIELYAMQKAVHESTENSVHHK